MDARSVAADARGGGSAGTAGGGGEATAGRGGAAGGSDAGGAGGSSAGDAGASSGGGAGGAGPAPDGGSTDQAASGGADGAGPSDAAGGEQIPLFVAQGHLGRTVVSCDDGRTWVGNRSDDDAGVCFTGGLDCDHTPGAGRGIAYGNGWFVATFGWGQPGSIKRSRDGVVWESVTSSTTFAGVVFGNGLFLAGGRPTWFSNGDGGDWKMGGTAALNIYNVRRTGFVPHAGGRFLLHANGGGNDTMLSSDAGKTWWRPSTLPATCGTDQWAGGFAYGGGVILMVNNQGVACRSSDGGMTFTAGSVGGAVEGRLVWTGSEFMTWGARGVYRSRDGASWTSQAVIPANVVIGPVTLGDSGTFVAVRGGWDQWYARQQFYRSRDGVTWEILPAGAYPAGHPMTFIASGRGARPAACR